MTVSVVRVSRGAIHRAREGKDNLPLHPLKRGTEDVTVSVVRVNQGAWLRAQGVRLKKKETE